MEKKKIDFCIGIFDNLSKEGLEKIENDIKNCEVYGIGIYTDDIVINNFYTQPLNNLEKRINTVKNINGVKFVFPLNTTEPDEIKEVIREEYKKYIGNN